MQPLLQNFSASNERAPDLLLIFWSFRFPPLQDFWNQPSLFSFMFPFYGFRQSWLACCSHRCEPSLRQHLNQTWREGRLDGGGVGWTDGWMCVMCEVKVFPLNPSDSWSSPSACSTTAGWRRNSTKSQWKSSYQTFLLFSKVGKNDAFYLWLIQQAIEI